MSRRVGQLNRSGNPLRFILDESPPRWDDAACRDDFIDPEWWFPVSNSAWAAQPARDICDTCPVRRPCADWALRHPEAARDGIWGGLTAVERTRILRRRRRARQRDRETA
jgi:WhiB family transcriptional regulator, redox-sensing transcriptional regulator